MHSKEKREFNEKPSVRDRLLALPLSAYRKEGIQTWGLASTSECLLPYGPPPGTKSADSGHGPHASTHLLHVVPQFFLEFLRRGEFLGSVGGSSEGGRDEKAQGFLQEQGGFSVAVAATPIIGHGKVENHPLGYRKEGKRRWNGGGG